VRCSSQHNIKLTSTDISAFLSSCHTGHYRLSDHLRGVLSRQLASGTQINLAHSPPWMQYALLWKRWLPSKQQPHITLKICRVESRPKPFHRLTISIHKELHIIPFNAVPSWARVGGGQRPGLLGSEVLVKRMSSRAIHINLIKNIKFKSKLSNSPVPFFLRGPWSLASELIARECAECEPITFVLIVQCPQAWVVHILQRSFTGNVHDHQYLSLVLGHRDLFLVH